MKMNQRLILEAVFKILADRVLTFTALLLNFALFVYAIIYPDYIRFATAGMFSISVFIPVLKLKGHTESQQREDLAA